MFFIAVAQAGGSGRQGILLQFLVEQLGLGTLIGLTIGLLGGALLGLGLTHTRPTGVGRW